MAEVNGRELTNTDLNTNPLESVNNNQRPNVLAVNNNNNKNNKSNQRTNVNQMISFRQVQQAVKVITKSPPHQLPQNPNTILINTFTPVQQQQHGLIRGTTLADKEEQMVQSALERDLSITILVYGHNALDPLPYRQADKLRNLGFANVYVYVGGMFEWLLLCDLYGPDQYPLMTVQEEDPMHHAPPL
jgi:hypothetical protein